MSIYGFRPGPTYRSARPDEQFVEAMDMPLSLGSTLWDQAKGGVMESFGLGTALKDITTPEAGGDQITLGRAIQEAVNPLSYAYGTTKRLVQSQIDAGNPISEDEYKNSPWYRENIPWDMGMTDNRAAALALMEDTRAVRAFYAQKRPITAFIGNLAGQATDPINYIPIAGPLVKAAAIERMGAIAGRAAFSATDAMLNTAIFGIGTADKRAQFGDDVSWQATVSQIALSAVIGAAFGTIGGLYEGRTEARTRAEVERQVSTLKADQEARIALNEGIDALARGEDLNLSPNAIDAVTKMSDEIVAYHGSPHDFTYFDINKIGSGEGAQAYGHGLYFAESRGVAESYKKSLNPFDEAIPTRVFDADPALADRLLTAQSKLEQINQAIRKTDDSGKIADLTAEAEKANAEYTSLLKTAQEKYSGQLYEVGIRAKPEDFLDWDKRLSEQSPQVRAALKELANVTDPTPWRPGSSAYPDEWSGAQLLNDLGDRKGVDEVRKMLDRAGIPGIKYLDAGSRDAGDGSRNYVVFDSARVRTRSKNGIDMSSAYPPELPRGLKEAEARIAKPDNYKMLAEQYGVDAETGSFREEADIQQLAIEGRLTEEDMAVLAESQNAYENSNAYSEALKAVVNCLV